ncbi:VOC family protein [Aureimonas mangrovi]|uniref:VOC family protein n=1 Tax=Aureimonas mangrovi TaxID=2758041 RepID=UPI00163DB21E|nr:VOC family protein [Aureimonas mangrovi]
MRSARRFDHAVFVVDTLEGARAALTALGFTVAPDARHPFGTENACVFLADGSFIEPLAVGHRETCEAAAKAGNAFVARDQAHRFRIGTPSFSAIALRSDDADGDAQDFEEAGYGVGERLNFGRDFRTPDGKGARLEFALAFARDLRAPDVSFFACQSVHSFKPDRSSLIAHENGAIGIARLVLSEPNPTDFQYYLQTVTGDREIDADSFAMTLKAGDTMLEVATPDALALRYGAKRDASRGLFFEGIVVAVRSLETVRPFTRDARELQGRLVVPLGPQSFIAFEECGR